MTLAQALQADVEQVKDFEVIIFDELSTMSKKDLDAVLSARSAADKSKDRTYLHNLTSSPTRNVCVD